jgi:hypothetical protein
MVPDDAAICVGYYPPEGFNQKPLGCGYTSKTDPSYVETEGDKGIYTPLCYCLLFFWSIVGIESKNVNFVFTKTNLNDE